MVFTNFVMRLSAITFQQINELNNRRISAQKSYKILVFGDVDVGKTSLVTRYVENRFSTIDTNPTNTMVKSSRFVDTLVDSNIEIIVCDCPSCDTIDFDEYQNADAALFLYDMTRIETLKSTERWNEMVDMNIFPNVCVKLLVGTKRDDLDNRKVFLEMARSHATKLDMFLHETSAKHGVEIENVFKAVCRRIRQRESTEVKTKRILKEKSRNFG